MPWERVFHNNTPWAGQSHLSPPYKVPGSQSLVDGKAAERPATRRVSAHPQTKEDHKEQYHSDKCTMHDDEQGNST